MSFMMFTGLYFFCVGVAIAGIEFLGLVDFFSFYAVSITYPLVILVALYLNLSDPSLELYDAQSIPWEELRTSSLEHPRHVA